MKRGLVAWFTGLSGAGKSTIAGLAAVLLRSQGFTVEIVDGDVIRQTVTRHLEYSRSGILENNRVIAEICAQRRLSCDVLLVPVISPFRTERERARRMLGEPFVEVYVCASVETLSRRDPKGLYALAKQGKVQLIGLSPEVRYEAPEQADLLLDTEDKHAQSLAETLAEFIVARLQLKNGDLGTDRAAGAADRLDSAS